MTTGEIDESGGRHRRLIYFVLGSLALHFAVVGAWRSSEPPAGPMGQSTFKVTLLARHGDTHSAQVAVIESAQLNSTVKPAASTNNHRQELQAITQHIAQIRTITRTAVAQAGQKSNGKDASEPGTQGKAIVAEGARAADRIIHAVLSQPASSAGAQTHGEHELTSEAKYRRVRAALTQALLPVFEYPSVARRRGWQGRVKVGLFLEAGGDLSRVYLIESSGHSVLDKAAMKNVTSLRNVPAVTQWLDSSGMEVMLPVSYQLDNR